MSDWFDDLKDKKEMRMNFTQEEKRLLLAEIDRLRGKLAVAKARENADQETLREGAEALKDA